MGKLEFSTDDLVIKEDGKIEINNIALAKSIVNHVKKSDPGTVGLFDNCNCDKGKSIAKIALKDVIKPQTFEIAPGIDPGTVGLFDNCNCSH